MRKSIATFIQGITKKGPIFLVGISLACLLVLLLIYQLTKGKKGYKLLLNTFRFIKESYRELTTKVSFPNREKVQQMVKYFLVGITLSTLILAGINQSLNKIMTSLYNSFPKSK